MPSRNDARPVTRFADPDKPEPRPKPWVEEPASAADQSYGEAETQAQIKEVIRKGDW